MFEGQRNQMNEVSENDMLIRFGFDPSHARTEKAKQEEVSRTSTA